jgi:transposase
LGEGGVPGLCATAGEMSRGWGTRGEKTPSRTASIRVAEVFPSSWHVVFGAVERAVAYGREHLDRSAIRSLGIDEIAWGRGHRYLTVVYPIDAHCKRLLWVGEKRTVTTLLTFFHWLGPERSAALRFIAVTCGSPISRSSPRRRGRPFTSWIAFTSGGTSWQGHR